MDSLNTIPNSGSFGDISSKLNDNFSKVGLSLMALEGAAFDPLTIRKSYNTLALANADTNPTGDDGQVIKIGQVVIVTSDSIIENNAIYKLKTLTSGSPTWEKVGLLGDINGKLDKTAILNIHDTRTKSYSQKSGDISPNALMLANNVPIEYDGHIKAVKLYVYAASEIGIIVLRKTGSSSFYIISETKVTTATGVNNIAVSIPVKKGDYVGYAQKAGARIPYFGATTGDGWWQLGSYPSVDTSYTLAYVANAWVAGTFMVESERYITEDRLYILNEKKYIDVTVTRNAADFNSIREKIASITDASDNKIYVINIPNGRWFECDIKGKKNIILRGQDKDKTILYCDGLSTKTVPADYSFGYSGQTLASIPRIWKHIVNVMSDLHMQNLTLEANDTKYCIHNDYTTSGMSLKCENVKLRALANVNNAIGIGLNGGQSIEMLGCEFVMNNPNDYSIFFHNWNNQGKNCKLSIRDSFFNSNYILLDELGSDYGDIVELLNCASSKTSPNVQFMVDYDESGKTFWTNPTTGLKEADPTLVPYCIKLYSNGTQIIGALSATFPFGSYGLSRPDFSNYVVGKLG